MGDKMKKIIIAFDSFKESLTALEACQACLEGLQQHLDNYTYDLIPLGDGGEGTSEILKHALNCNEVIVDTYNPFMQPIQAKYTYNNVKKVAVIECASCVGIDLIAVEKRDPTKGLSYGLGIMIKDALNKGAKRIVLGLGGSGTNDGGYGMLHALGVKFYDQDKQELDLVLDNINHIASIDFSQAKMLLKDASLEIASDVDNPFIGPLGATYTFGPQKGSNQQQLEYLEKSLTHLSNIVNKQYNIDLSNINKTGAAGGLGGALYLIGGKLDSGIELVLDLVDFDKRIEGAAYIFTGEGSIDSQTINGKTISGVLKHSNGVPVIALAGRIKDATNLYDIGLTSMFSITNEAKSLKQALDDGYDSLKDTSYNIARIIK